MFGGNNKQYGQDRCFLMRSDEQTKTNIPTDTLSDTKLLFTSKE